MEHKTKHSSDQVVKFLGDRLWKFRDVVVKKNISSKL